MSSSRFNPFTGNFVPVNNNITLTDEEIIRIFNKITTSDVNVLGNPNFFYDDVACKFVEAGPQILFDDDGNVVLDPC